MNRRCIHSLCRLMVLAGLVFAPCALWGQRGAYTATADLDQLVRSAHTIFRGHVVSARIEPHPQFPNLQTVVVTMTVDRLLKGEASSTITFRQFIWDSKDLPSSADYHKADELILFLNPVSPYGLTSPVGLEQGRFRVLRGAKGARFAVNGRGNAGLFEHVASRAATRGVVFSKQTSAMLSKPGGEAPLASFEDAILTIAGSQK